MVHVQELNDQAAVSGADVERGDRVECAGAPGGSPLDVEAEDDGAVCSEVVGDAADPVGDGVGLRCDGGVDGFVAVLDVIGGIHGGGGGV